MEKRVPWSSREPASPPVPWAPRWWAVLGVGLALWIASVVVASLTGNINLIPAIVMLGSFVVPVTGVVWYLDHDPSPAFGPQLIAYSFIVGGVLGILAASVLEYWLLTLGILGTVGVGLIEEFVKALALVMMAWRLASFHPRDGIVLGATVGFGFAALESSGYAMRAMIIDIGGVGVIFSLSSLVFTELFRGLLSPFGHGLWTAILGGVLFGEARGGRLRITRAVAATFLGVALLHAAWDTMPAVMVASGGWGIIGYVAVSVIGLAWLIRLWRRSRSMPARQKAYGG
ncbi:MAG TPA: PrsW family glutamic-type intramembrane protease [Candidatus Limnocylindrales bacterium]|nr:PrsW family glutamic-type intramembrane protease [Candidatus Limnocylindrales bacterium]